MKKMTHYDAVAQLPKDLLHVKAYLVALPHCPPDSTCLSVPLLSRVGLLLLLVLRLLLRPLQCAARSSRTVEVAELALSLCCCCCECCCCAAVVVPAVVPPAAAAPAVAPAAVVPAVAAVVVAAVVAGTAFCSSGAAVDSVTAMLLLLLLLTDAVASGDVTADVTAELAEVLLLLVLTATVVLPAVAAAIPGTGRGERGVVICGGAGSGTTLQQ
jgi:hypothetical protein